MSLHESKCGGQRPFRTYLLVQALLNFLAYLLVRAQLNFPAYLLVPDQLKLEPDKPIEMLWAEDLAGPLIDSG